MTECPNCRSLAVESRECSDHCHSCGIEWIPSRSLSGSGDPIPAGFWDWIACGTVVAGHPKRDPYKKRAAK